MRKIKFQAIMNNITLAVVLIGLLGVAVLLSLLTWLGVIRVWGVIFG